MDSFPRHEFLPASCRGGPLWPPPSSEKLPGWRRGAATEGRPYMSTNDSSNRVAAAGAAVNFLKRSAKVFASRLDRVINLLGVMIHLGAAIRTFHFSRVCHSDLSSQLDVFSPVSQDLRHPDKLFDELVDSPLISRFDKPPILIERLLNAREVSIPEDGDQAEFPHHRQKVLRNPGSPKRPG